MNTQPLSVAILAKSFYVFCANGLALPLLAPILGRLAGGFSIHEQALMALLLIGTYLVSVIAASDRRIRLVCLGLLFLELVIAALVAGGRRIDDVDFPFYGKYNDIALMWFTLAMAFPIGEVCRRWPKRLRLAFTLSASVVVAGFIAGRATAENQHARDAKQRKFELYTLTAIFDRYADDAAPANLRIPTLDGAFIEPVYPSLFVYNLTHYRPFLRSRDRVTLLTSPWMDGWGHLGSENVRSLRAATDASFVDAPEREGPLRDLYLGPVALRLEKPPAHAVLRPVNLSLAGGAAGPESPDRILKFHSESDATLRPGDSWWDPEVRHRLLMRIDGDPALTPGRLDRVKVSLRFRGERAFPYVWNTARVPAGGGAFTVDLLQLYSYSLNPRVGDLELRVSGAGSYAVTTAWIESGAPLP